MRAIIFLLLFSVVFAKNVLIINSYSIRLPWTKGELEGILNKINDRNDLKIFIEFMDTKYFRPTPLRMHMYYFYLYDKYKDLNFDIIITTDDNALNFVKKYKNHTLFKDSKVFFSGVNNLKLAQTLPKETYAGVFEKKEPLANLNFAKKIVKNLKTVYVVADNSNSAKAVMKEYESAFKNVRDVNFIYVNDKNLENVLGKIKNPPKNSAMLLLTPFSFSLEGSHINYKYAIALISQIFNHPIIIHSDLLAGVPNSNVVGGKATDALTQGEEVGKKVLEYLDNKKMKEIGFTFEKANKMYLNVLNLKKFGIDAYGLGYKNAVFVNEPESFFERYKEWIIGFLFMVFGVFVIAVILLIKNYQLRKFNERISKINKKLESKVYEALEKLKSKEKLLNQHIRVSSIGEMFLMNSLEIKKTLLDLKEKKEFEIIDEIISKLSLIENYFSDNNPVEFDLKEATLEVLKSLNVGFIEVKGESIRLFGYKNRFQQVVIDFVFNISRYKDKVKKIVIEFKNDKIVVNIQFKKISKELVSEFQDLIKNDLTYSKVILEQYFCKECNYFFKQNSVNIEIIL